MWRILEFEIKIVKNLAKPNTLIAGVVNLKLTDSLSARCIRVRFTGEEVAKMLEDPTGTTRRDTKVAKTTFFDIEVVLWGNSPYEHMFSGQRSIPSGDHTFPFTVEMPNVNYPPSFEPAGSMLLGHCRYTLRAYIDTLGIPNWYVSKPANIKFRPVVIALVNSSFAYHNRLKQSKKAGELVEVDVQLTMPREVWFPGESVSLDVQLVNMSTTTITSLRYCIQQRIDIVFDVEKEYKSTYTKELALTENFLDLKVGLKSRWHREIPIHIPPDTDIPTFCGTYHTFSFQIAFKIGHTRSRYDKESLIDWILHIPLANVSAENARKYFHVFSYKNPPTEPQIRQGEDDEVRFSPPGYRVDSEPPLLVAPTQIQPQPQLQPQLQLQLQLQLQPQPQPQPQPQAQAQAQPQPQLQVQTSETHSEPPHSFAFPQQAPPSPSTPFDFPRQVSLSSQQVLSSTSFDFPPPSPTPFDFPPRHPRAVSVIIPSSPNKSLSRSHTISTPSHPSTYDLFDVLAPSSTRSSVNPHRAGSPSSSVSEDSERE